MLSRTLNFFLEGGNSVLVFQIVRDLDDSVLFTTYFHYTSLLEMQNNYGEGSSVLKHNTFSPHQLILKQFPVLKKSVSIVFFPIHFSQ